MSQHRTSCIFRALRTDCGVSNIEYVLVSACACMTILIASNAFTRSARIPVDSFTSALDVSVIASHDGGGTQTSGDERKCEEDDDCAKDEHDPNSLTR